MQLVNIHVLVNIAVSCNLCYNVKRYHACTDAGQMSLFVLRTIEYFQAPVGACTVYRYIYMHDKNR